MTAAPAIPSATPFPALEAAVARVKDGSAAFAALPLPERIALLRAMFDGIHGVAEAMVRLACEAKGHAFDSPVSGEEWLAGPYVTLRVMRTTLQSLEELQAHGRPLISDAQLRELPDGRLAVRVFPTTRLDGALLAKTHSEVHMLEHVTRANLAQHQASFYRKPHGGRVCLVLGAGNVNAIAPTDVVYKMFVEGTACVLKMNPVNAYIGPLLETAFAAAIARGFFAVVYGGAEEGGFLTHHPAIDEVHITGSDKTHDALVFGVGEEGRANKAKKTPTLHKPMSSELGCVTPVLLVPGPWTAAELAFQARNLAGMTCNNASFNCNSPKLLVTSRQGSARGAFLEQLEVALGQGGVRKAYYPGAQERWDAFTQGRKNVKRIGEGTPGTLPWALITDVDRADLSDRVFTQEPWCAVLSETAFDAADASSFLREAVPFVNAHVWGTLSAIVLVHPATAADPAHAGAVEQALRDLKYGAVVVNLFPGAVFGLGVTPWGAHPSSTLENIQSGRGWVHNSLMLEGIEKVVLQGPATAFPVHPWFPGHRTQHTLGRKLVALEYAPSWLKVPGIALTGLRG